MRVFGAIEMNERCGSARSKVSVWICRRLDRRLCNQTVQGNDRDSNNREMQVKDDVKLL